MQAAPYSTTFVGGLDEESPDTRPSEICNHESDNLAGHLAHPSATVLVEYVQIVFGLHPRDVAQNVLAYAEANSMHLRDVPLNCDASVHGDG